MKSIEFTQKQFEAHERELAYMCPNVRVSPYYREVVGAAMAWGIRLGIELAKEFAEVDQQQASQGVADPEAPISGDALEKKPNDTG